MQASIDATADFLSLFLLRFGSLAQLLGLLMFNTTTTKKFYESVMLEPGVFHRGVFLITDELFN